MKKASLFGLIIILGAPYLSNIALACGKEVFPCLGKIAASDAVVVSAPDGRIICKKNEAKRYIPASTLKVFTALTALNCLGQSYRFRTELYLDQDRNLKVKGYGDPLLVSEAWGDISNALATKIRNINDLILDDTYFSRHITIPGRGNSTNPYDAPVGALCANFNTIFFDRDPHGKIISAEPQTPLTPLARKKITSLGLKRGRYTFTHDQGETTLYAGELFRHFLKERGVEIRGITRLGTVGPGDRLIYTYWSRFTLEDVLGKMLVFSNNFIANQTLIALGAHTFGPPGTLGKGVRVITEYGKKELQLGDIRIAEGSGISRNNRLSALDMVAVLERFRPYRNLLKREGNVFFKTGSLMGVRTLAGYVDGGPQGLCSFVIFLNRPDADIGTVMDCLRISLGSSLEQHSRSIRFTS
jgi:D-alanyl-D-alanine carboxypeptidase/D-alanyl-D-alanine-endopeptidase (penicillin-binding protein 4)